MSMFLMDGFVAAAVRACHKTAKLCEDGDIVHSCGNQNFLVCFFHAGSDDMDIVRLWSGL